MQKDIAPELLAAVQKTFREEITNNAIVRKLLQKLEKGTATYEEADQYAAEIGDALAAAFRRHVSSDTLPDGKMYYNIASRLIPPPLRETYEMVAAYAETMQKSMNERARLRISPQIAKYNADREKGLIEHAVQADQYDTVRKSFEQDLVNFSQAVVTDTLKENAEFQYQAGLSPVIRRTTNGGCCDWCAKLAGTYSYEDVRDTGNDVYRRHRKCRCTVTFDPGDGKIQNVHTKRWTPLQNDDTIKQTNDRLLLPPPKQLEFAVDIENNPAMLGQFTPGELKAELENRGFPVVPLGRGKLKGIPLENGGGFKINYRGDGILQYHPAAGSRHGGAYYKVGNARNGIRRYYLNGQRKG